MWLAPLPHEPLAPPWCTWGWTVRPLAAVLCEHVRVLGGGRSVSNLHSAHAKPLCPVAMEPKEWVSFGEQNKEMDLEACSNQQSRGEDTGLPGQLL